VANPLRPWRSFKSFDDWSHGRRRSGYHRGVPKLRVRTEEVDGVKILAVEGEVDLSTVEEFIQRLFEASASGRERIVLDLAPASFIDSTVVNTLFASIARIRRAGGDLAIVCPNPDLRRLLEITGLDAIFATTDDRAQALAALATTKA
jgi:anti-sigma B factor antagonist